MKKIFFLLLVAISLNTSAQVMYPYSFSSATQVYQNLVSPTDIAAGFSWDDSVFTVPLGFNFKWSTQGNTINSIQVNANGILYAPLDTVQIFGENLFTRAMMPYSADLCDKTFNTTQTGISAISYLTSGTAGSKICKIEYRNMGFYFDSAAVDSTNFQIWLYEGSNKIEYHYGPWAIQDFTFNFEGSGGPTINLAHHLTYDLVNLDVFLDTCTYVTGDNVTFSSIYSTTPISYTSGSIFFDGVPDNGQVFIFTPYSGVGIPAIDKHFPSVHIFSNAAENEIAVQANESLTGCIIRDVSGKIMYSSTDKNNRYTIPTTSYANGLYFVTVFAGELQKTVKVMKSN